jgi:hypothetical protein
VERLAHPQPALIDEGEVGAVAAVAEGAEQPGDLAAGEDVGQRILAFDPDLRPDLPGLAEMVAVEGAQGADGLVEGGGGELAVVLEVEEEIEDPAAVEIGERGAGVVVGELGSPAEVGPDGAFAQAFEVDEAGVILIPPCGGGDPAS